LPARSADSTSTFLGQVTDTEDSPPNSTKIVLTPGSDPDTSAPMVEFLGDSSSHLFVDGSEVKEGLAWLLGSGADIVDDNAPVTIEYVEAGGVRRIRTMRAQARPRPTLGPELRSVHLDTATPTSDYKAAVRTARQKLGELVGFWYESPQDRPVGLPDQKKALLREATFVLVPAYEFVGRPTTATSLFNVTRPARRQYVLLLVWRGRIAGGCDWAWNEYDRWSAFYSDLTSLDFRDSLSAAADANRFILGTHCYYVDSRSGNQEDAGVLLFDGSYPDGPQGGSVGDVLRYEARSRGWR